MRRRTAPDDLVVGIDQGTSKLKVAAFDFEGRAVAEVATSSPVRVAGSDCVEGDPEQWWKGLAASLRELVGPSGINPRQVRGVGLCGMMHSFVLVDVHGTSTGPVPLWPDQRYRLLDGDQRNPVAEDPHASGCLGRLRWQLGADEGARERVRHLLPVKDFLRYRLTGVAACDPFEARATGLLDPQSDVWHEELLDALGLQSDALPPISAPDEMAGAVSAPSARETGLVAGTPVVVGTGDWHAALLGSAAWIPGRVALTLGTAGTLGAFQSVRDFERLREPVCFGAVTSTGSALHWAGTVLATSEATHEPEPSRRTVRLAAQSLPGASGVTFLPHLMGERGNTVRPSASGTFAGLRVVHEPADLARAVLEGTASWLRLVAERSLADQPFGALVASGDGARAMLNLQIAAALYDKPVIVPEVVDAGTLGVAQLVTRALGAAGNRRETAEEWLRPRTVVEPDPRLVEEYRHVFERFRQTEEGLRSLEDR